MSESVFTTIGRVEWQSQRFLETAQESVAFEFEINALNHQSFLTVSLASAVLFRNERVGRVVRADLRSALNELIVSVKIEIVVDSANEVRDSFRAYGLQVSNNGNLIISHGDVDESRRIVRELRQQARDEGLLGPAEYVE